MIRNLLPLLFVAALILPAQSFGGEVLKLRHAASLYGDAKGAKLQKPEGTACTDNSLLIVADTGNGRLLKYTYQDGLFEPAGEFTLPELASPGRLQVKADGEILAFDGKQRRIVRISPDGAFVGYVEPAGLPAPDAFAPKSFTIDARGNLYILDVLSERVVELDSTGKYVREIKFPGEYGFLSDVAVDARGRVLVLDSVRCRVYSASRTSSTFSPLTETLKEYMRFPTFMTLDTNGMIYIVDQNGGSLVLLDPDGKVQGQQLTAGWKDGLVRYPAQLCITKRGDFFIADRENDRIQVFTQVR